MRTESALEPGIQNRDPSMIHLQVYPVFAVFEYNEMLDRSLGLIIKRLILAACLWTAAPGAAFGQTLEVVPNRVMVDESAVIRARGFTPGESFTIQSELVDGADERWSAQAEFTADSEGALDTSRQAPVKGSYEGVSAMGLVWSMRPAKKHVPSYQPPRDLGSQSITFRVIRDGQQSASAQLEQLGVADGVRRVNVDGQLHGVLLLPNTSERRPGALVLGGSEGGLPLPKAAWLASRGYAAFAVAYFRYDDLPPRLEGIPLEYFQSALAWMMQRPEISPDRIGVVGTSRGGELALQLGSMFPQIRAVVAYVPANVRYPACCGNTRMPYAWTWQGHPLAFVLPRVLRDPETAIPASIAVEHIDGPILLVSGSDDGVWDSTGMADAIVSRLKQTRFRYSYESLKYPHAGHRAGRPEIVPTWHGSVRNPTSGREQNLGGSPQGDAQSSLDAIPKVLEFLRQSLAGP
jgi:dienelactone hydrolase